MQITRMYKIRDKKTGKFSPGGKYGYLTDSHFTKSGRFFTETGVQDYLQPVPWIKSKDYLANCEVVAFEIRETEIEILPIHKVKAAANKRYSAEKKHEDERTAAEQIRLFGETF
jgi:hypothetical protein